MAKEYDIVILGGGTGGYVAAIRASQLGLKTAVVEKEKLGGTCLHKGCIPSKSLLRSAEVFAQTKNGEEYGILAKEIKLDFQKVQIRKQRIVDQLHRGVQQLMKKGKIDLYHGVGRILGPSIFAPVAGTISVEMNDGNENEILIPKHVIIATGSRPKTLNGLEIDGDFILSSNEALELSNVPSSVLIVGGGAIGIEWASMLKDFGSDVTIIEYANRLLPSEDHDISRELEIRLKKKGIRIVTNAKILTDTVQKEKTTATVQVEVNGERLAYSAEKILVCVGRQANIEDIGLENTDIQVNQGVIQVNDYFQTKERHIYAIGDVIGGLQLAHVASREGMIAVEHIAGLNPEPLDYSLVPKCIYSSPEIASVGWTEQEAKEKGLNLKIGKFPFRAVGKALVYGQSDGFVKLIVDRDTDDVLGVHMIGPHVTDMISEAGLARFLDAASWEVAHAIHPHPTLSEALGEAAFSVDGKAIHL
ncbi:MULTISPECIES: dihydrolipoyl dehydrogenase [Bacillus]|jgi:dihydrolipoamide dehydrogenase|uniref:dihydrolipoyl dehydrogenase n=1 Tax=Bacillus TaxID=1386 RepID=UPI00065DE3AA|nr:dihydrolipoyl dehydrogenase [Bacillus smithii]AKP47729.1 Dihydrolipoamide dehydrogenase of branched-chain alpha-keto acid dehydrogenase [Bacillus smithii]MED4883366.1 dihydrolipoyl dehydrogenase [Bacillus smithii]MED4927193.1 dihydrolipoyl dehydrogenase [Bacillus smithii]